MFRYQCSVCIRRPLKMIAELRHYICVSAVAKVTLMKVTSGKSNRNVTFLELQPFVFVLDITGDARKDEVTLNQLNLLWCFLFSFIFPTVYKNSNFKSFRWIVVPCGIALHVLFNQKVNKIQIYINAEYCLDCVPELVALWTAAFVASNAGETTAPCHPIGCSCSPIRWRESLHSGRDCWEPESRLVLQVTIIYYFLQW